VRKWTFVIGFSILAMVAMLALGYASYLGGTIAFIIVLLLTFVFTDSDIKFILTWREKGSTRDKSGDASDSSEQGAANKTRSEAAQGAGDSLHEQALALDPSCGLSLRELEVLEMFAQGRSANWIAAELTVSKNTVRSHLRTIYVKLGIHTRQELLDLLRGTKG